MKACKNFWLAVVWIASVMFLAGCGASSSPNFSIEQPNQIALPASKNNKPFDEIGLALVALDAQKRLDLEKACSAYKSLLNREFHILRFQDVLQDAVISLISCGDFETATNALMKTGEPLQASPLAPLIFMSDGLAKNQPVTPKESLDIHYPLLLSNRIALYWNYQAKEQTTAADQETIEKLQKNQFQIDDIKLYRELVMLYTEIFASGFIAVFQEDYARAVERWLMLYEQIDDRFISTQIARLIVYALTLQGQQEEALGFLKTQSDLDPVLEKLATEIKQGQISSRIFTSPQNNLAEIFLFIAMVYRQDLPQEALFYAALAQHLHQRPEVSQYALLKSYIFSVQENRESTKQVVKEASSVGAHMPYHLEINLLKARLLFRQGDHKDAISRIDKLTELYPDRRDLRMTKANFLRLDDQLEAAIETYNQLIEEIKTDAQPEHWRYYFNRGVALEQNQSWPAAEGDMVKALSLKPDEPRVLNYLGYSWVDRKIHLKRGMAMLRRALELAPNDAHIIDSFGWANYNLGNYQEALIHLERAVQMLSTDPIVNDHLGDAYWQVGREREAYFQWRRALQMSPDDQHTTKLLRKISGGL